jgi:hypothetical protein
VQWLASYAAMSSPVFPLNSTKKLDAVRKAAGQERWSRNRLRHSFALYRLAATSEAATVAVEVGHSKAQLLYSTPHVSVSIMSERRRLRNRCVQCN